MNNDNMTARFLGATFLIVAITSATAAAIFPLSGSISEMMQSISRQSVLFQWSIVIDLITSLGIVVLAALLYRVLHRHNKAVATIAFGFWIAEAIFLALCKLGAFALIPLSTAFVKAGSPVDSFYQQLGEFLYSGLFQRGYLLHFWFYCLGGVLWYSLFTASKIVPRVISVWGLVAVTVSLVGIVFQFFGAEVSIFLYLPILPFELSLGTWLLLKGIKKPAEQSAAR